MKNSKMLLIILYIFIVNVSCNHINNSSCKRKVNLICGRWIFIDKQVDSESGYYLPYSKKPSYISFNCDNSYELIDNNTLNHTISEYGFWYFKSCSQLFKIDSVKNDTLKMDLVELNENRLIVEYLNENELIVRLFLIKATSVKLSMI